MSEQTPVVIKNKVHVPKPVEELKSDIDSIQTALRQVMKDDVHYGVIPGTDKPTLYKPGAEIILSMFRIAVDPNVEDLSTEEHIRYRVQCKGTHMPTGGHIGVGVGEASTKEEKYAWRAAVCQEEYDDTPEHRRRIKYKKRWKNNPNEPDQVDRLMQVRQNPADLANTILKMAKKRAMIDLTLTATAASDAFTQDMEDLQDVIPAGETVGEHVKANTQKPQRRQSGGNKQNNGKATEPQVRMISARLNNGNVSLEACLKAFNVTALEDLPINKVNDVLDWIQGEA